MIPIHLPTDGAIHELAIRIARRCRHIVQACLREEEWGDADREFYRICREELVALTGPTSSMGGKA